MNATKGMQIKLNGELRQIVCFRRAGNGVQYVVHASLKAAARIASGQLDDVTAYLTGLADVRRMNTQEFHRLAGLGRIVSI